MGANGIAMTVDVVMMAVPMIPVVMVMRLGQSFILQPPVDIRNLGCRIVETVFEDRRPPGLVRIPVDDIGAWVELREARAQR
ncbi:hypothetical protein D3C87_1760220 [compost metagenome]